MSLRPEESIRKAIAAGYGNPVGPMLGGQPDDGTEVLCQSSGTFEFGDWVHVAGNANGFMTITTPSGQGLPQWLGVVRQAVNPGEWCRVKVAGACEAKVTGAGTAAAGDPLHLKTSTSAEVPSDLATAGTLCGRFMTQIGGLSMGWVRIAEAGDAKPDIFIHHHTDGRNTRFVDRTAVTQFIGYAWHLFRVVQRGLTSGPHSLMLAIGGNADHGETNKEGYCWGGVIGAPGAVGFGQLGGNEVSGNQGLIGAEETTADAANRLNFRSYGGWNVSDQFAGLMDKDGIGPLNFAHPNWGSQTPDRISWHMPALCATDEANCPDIYGGMEIWAGALFYDHHTAPANATGWPHVWSPGIPVERNCCRVNSLATPKAHEDCRSVENPEQFEMNAQDLNGPYENIIPYGYTAINGRSEILAAVCCLVRHIQSIWRFLDGYTAVMEKFMQCVDATFATKADAPGTEGHCCEDAGETTVTALVCGPPNKEWDCEQTWDHRNDEEEE